MGKLTLAQAQQMSAELKAIENLVACVRNNTEFCFLQPNWPEEMHMYGIEIVEALGNVLKVCKKCREASYKIPIESSTLPSMPLRQQAIRYRTDRDSNKRGGQKN